MPKVNHNLTPDEVLDFARDLLDDKFRAGLVTNCEETLAAAGYDIEICGPSVILPAKAAVEKALAECGQETPIRMPLCVLFSIFDCKDT